MNQTYKNKILAEYSREELEENFLKNCEQLDKKASQIIQLEQKAQYLSSRLSRLTQDMQSNQKVQERFGGSQAPSAYRQSQITVRELQDQIAVVERDISQRRLKRDAIARQVKYFKSLQNFPVHKTKSRSSSRNVFSPTNLTKEDVQGAIEDLLSKKTLPKMANRLQATISILAGDYQAAEEPLRSLMHSIGENLSLYECLERRKQLFDRDTKIEKLSDKLDELKQRYNEMIAHQKEQIDQYNNEADQNNQKTKEIMDLQQQRETKISEAQKTAEMKIISDGLRSEIELLENQKAKLQGENNDRQIRVQTQVQDVLSKLKAEIETLESKCQDMKDSNSELEATLAGLDDEYSEAKKQRSETEVQFNELQEEYKKVLGTFNTMIETIDTDPFDDSKFVTFLTQMASKGWSPEKIRSITDEYEKLNAKLTKLKDKISQNEQEETEFHKRLGSKREEIYKIESQLKNLANDLNQPTQEVQLIPPQYTLGAEHIKVERSFINQLESDKTAIVFLFREFKLSPSFIGKKPSQIFLSVDFLEQESKTTKMVNPTDPTFDSQIIFIIKNDFILKTYLQRSAVPVLLCRNREDQITEAGKSEIVLLPFLDDVNEFTTSIKLWSSTGKAIGNLTFETKILKPLSQ